MVQQPLCLHELARETQELQQWPRKKFFSLKANTDVNSLLLLRGIYWKQCHGAGWGWWGGLQLSSGWAVPGHDRGPVESMVTEAGKAQEKCVFSLLLLFFPKYEVSLYL